MPDTPHFFIAANVEHFTKLEPLLIDLDLKFNTSEIADIRGFISVSIFGHVIKNDAPVFNLIEIIEFLYGLAIGGEQPVPLTIDMEPLLYGWRHNDGSIITLYKSKDNEFGGNSNILGVLKDHDIASAIHTTLDQLNSIRTYDPLLYIYVTGRGYRRSGFTA